jgi:hypothetical protein
MGARQSYSNLRKYIDGWFRRGPPRYGPRSARVDRIDAQELAPAAAVEARSAGRLSTLSMAQIFSPGATLVIKLALIGVPFLAAVGAVAAYKAVSPRPGVEHAPRQPIPFSHKHHAGDDGIDCRYCHTWVEKEAFAGMPSTHTCLTCHSQLFSSSPLLEPLFESARQARPIAWTRVYKLPDFVFFDHSIHVSKGVGCVECHGRVDEMPLMRRVASLEMQWCLDCHRDPGPHLRPAGQVFDMRSSPPSSHEQQQALVSAHNLLDERRRTDCSTCHR